jgi:hypothetical protein|tara:strand:- start:4869 stop:5228 length:360 start_codon:yes stop_codon:yes gene_type:complete
MGMIRLTDLLSEANVSWSTLHRDNQRKQERESAESEAIRLIGTDSDLVAANYVSWLEDNLEDLEEQDELTAQQRYDAVLKARYALMDSEADDIVAYIMRHHGASMHPKNELVTFIRKFL